MSNLPDSVHALFHVPRREEDVQATQGVLPRIFQLDGGDTDHLRVCHGNSVLCTPLGGGQESDEAAPQPQGFC